MVVVVIDIIVIIVVVVVVIVVVVCCMVVCLFVQMEYPQALAADNNQHQRQEQTKQE